MLLPLNSTMIAVGIPDIARDFGRDVGTVTLLVSGYLIAMASLQNSSCTIRASGSAACDDAERRPSFAGAR